MNLNKGHIHFDIEEGKPPEMKIDADSTNHIVAMVSAIIMRMADFLEYNPESLMIYKEHICELLEELVRVGCDDESLNNSKQCIDERELIYNFYKLSWIKQIDILMELELVEKEDGLNFTAIVINNAIELAKEQGKLEDLYRRILVDVSKTEITTL